MSTQAETIAYILEKIGEPRHFTFRAMFGEYALYADGKVVALVCDDTLYVKILPASAELEPLCEKGPPYPGAKDHYVVEEGQIHTIPYFAELLRGIADALPAKKLKRKKVT
ncbi:MAG: TfoX/Sxy family protein [Minisyncoccia bacterium]